MALDDGPELLYGFSLCFAVGIWLVFNRYQSVKSRAVPFSWPAPDVSLANMLYSPSRMLKAKTQLDLHSRS